jgi:hypothetical protein
MPRQIRRSSPGVVRHGAAASGVVAPTASAPSPSRGVPNMLGPALPLAAAIHTLHRANPPHTACGIHIQRFSPLPRQSKYHGPDHARQSAPSGACTWPPLDQRYRKPRAAETPHAQDPSAPGLSDRAPVDPRGFGSRPRAPSTPQCSGESAVRQRPSSQGHRRAGCVTTD